MTTYLSSDEIMYNAYNNGKDLYAMIARAAFDNNYEDNLEYYSEFSKIKIDQQEFVAGSGKEYIIDLDDNKAIIVPRCYLLETPNGFISADKLKVNDIVFAENCKLTIANIEATTPQIINNISVDMQKIIFS